MNQSAPIVKPKQKAKQLFEIAAIKKVAYIDDKFNTDAYRSDFIGILKEMFKSRQNREEIDFVDWDKPEPIFEKNIERIWNDADSLLRNKYLKILYDIKGNKEEWINLNGVTEMPTHLAGYIETFSPKEWETKRDEFLQENTNEDSRVLCLFDKELKSEAGRDGIVLLTEVLSGNYVDKVYCGVFSQHVSIGNEFEQKRKWVTDYTLPENIARKFYPISKETMKDDPVWGFIEGIKNVLVVEKVEQLKDQSKEILLRAQKRAVESLNDLSPETYNQIVQKSSKQEGTWEMNTLFRVSNLFQELAFTNSISDPSVRREFNTSIADVRKYDNIEIDNSQARLGRESAELREKEVLENGKIINTLHLPISNGDIFKLCQKEYILLGQPCNLSLRDGRRANNFELATLVQVVDKKPNSYFEKLPSFDKWVKFAMHYSLKLDVLDLAVFNDDGTCRIRLNEDLTPEVLYYESLEKRYKKLLGVFRKCADRINELQKVLSKSNKIKQFDFLLKPIVTLDSSFKGLPKRPYNSERDEFNFEIQRTGRLKDPYASHMLQQFTYYLSRNAFDHDFSK